MIVACAFCNTELIRIPSRCKSRNYCNAAHQMQYEYNNKIRDRNKITRKANQKYRELAKEGKLYLQQIENQIKRAKFIYEQRKENPNQASKWELIFRHHLEQHHLPFDEEYPLNKFNLDFAFPNDKIAIEVNIGWHNSETHRSKDKQKKEFLEKENWKLFINKCPKCDWVLRFR